MTRLLLIGCGGFLGAIARYSLSQWLDGRDASGFPLGTLVVNVLGCILLGYLMVHVERRPGLGPDLQLFLKVGLLGAFTTFSTFGVETIDLLGQGARGVAFASVAANVLLGLGAVLAGRALGQMIWPGAPLAG